MVTLKVYSDPNEAIVSCLLINDDGSEKNIVTISLEDNGIHVHKLVGEDSYYILSPIAQIDVLIKEVIEEIAEELNIKSIVFKFGEYDENTNDLVLSDEWYNIEKLALAASKHTALSSDIESKIVIGIVKFTNYLFAATVIRKEDTFPLVQVIYDKSYNPSIIKIFNELGQLVEERRENIDNFNEYVKSLVSSSEDVTIIYRESLEEIPSPREVTSDNGDKHFIGVIFKYIAGFIPSLSENMANNSSNKKIILKNKKKFIKFLRAILYVDKLSKEGGVEVILPSYAVSLPLVYSEIEKLKSRTEKILLNKLNIKEENINYFGASEELLKELSNAKNSINNEFYLDVRILPIAFLIVANTKQQFDDYAKRIINGPTSDGYEILDELIKDNLSTFFIGYLMSLEEALIIYSDIFNELSKDGK
ncbi:hypothetical protein DFR86_02400 [Acidianus sulfidivorans JP7]|uniref:Uncharacterized protein n=1 Tax=Acidianus sulfidivorans JP7 TaxID=619593 RepID=A0A2U9IKF1_9CREN|nr:hypothetical protein [Acidianus sulfidivorans]AWR96511.1 hypothetical protein DFR86_02400 [Acidianus sulfidivorans JP7]